MKTALQAALGAILSVTLGKMGYPYSTGEFWVVFGIVLSFVATAEFME